MPPIFLRRSIQEKDNEMYRVDLLDDGYWKAYGWWDTEEEANAMGRSLASFMRCEYRTERDDDMVV